MSTKSTPGPWEISTGITHTFIKHKNIHICEIERDAWEYLTNDANAKLIAAAPELLEALQNVKILFAGREHWPEVIQALNAIKKATV